MFQLSTKTIFEIFFHFKLGNVMEDTRNFRGPSEFMFEISKYSQFEIPSRCNLLLR